MCHFYLLYRQYSNCTLHTHDHNGNPGPKLVGYNDNHNNSDDTIAITGNDGEAGNIPAPAKEIS